MKIVRLSSENVKRLTAVEITPDGNLITIGGKNGAGKSSVLDSIAYALGGQTLIPVEPIRQGETEAKIVVDLGDFIVTRKFNRRSIHTEKCAQSLDNTKPCDCQLEFGPTTSTLVVTNKDGAKYPTPQAILDKLLGRLTFDPLAFAQSKDQHIILRKLVGIDTSELDDERKTAMALRTDLNRQLKAQQTLLAAAKNYPDVPTEEIPLEEVSRTMMEAEQLRTKAGSATSARLQAEQIRDNSKMNSDNWEKQIITIREQLVTAEKEYTATKTILAQDLLTVHSRIEEETAAKDLIPDVSVIQKRLSEIEDINQKVRANAAKNSIKSTVDRLALAADAQTAEIESIDLAKKLVLEKVQFPVEGLGLSETGITFNGVPFEQASTSEQLRTSVAIGLALNPTLKVLLVRNGNSLDKDSLLAVAEQAAKAEAQVWMEYVTEEAGCVAVMIEDGHVQ